MIGLYSSLKELNKLGYKRQFTISCDMPFIKPKVIRYMSFNFKEYDYVIPQWNNGYIEPLFAIYPIKATLKMVVNCLESKKLKLTNLLDKKSTKRFISIENEIIKYDNDLNTFININKKQDVQIAKKKIKKK